MFGFEWIHFLKAAREQARLDPIAVLREGEAAPRHQAYHWRVVRAGAICGAISFLPGIAFAVMMYREGGGKELDLKEVILLLSAPLMCVVAGMLLGAAATCLVAPREFLLGPIGEKWMAWIGVRTTAAARFVCGLVIAVIVAFVVFAVLAGT
jgi:hypothetical protein